MQSQILILEDLGIPRADVEELAATLAAKLIWGEEAANPEAVRILVTVKQKVDRERLEKYPQLQMLAVAFTGYDHVALQTCRERGIAVYNVPAYSTDSVAELSVGLSIALLRQIPSAQQLVKAKKWNLRPGLELSGKKVGILGTGKIGMTTARIFKALGCEIIGWSRSKKEAFKDIGGHYMADKQEIFALADIVSVHLPLNRHTRGMVGKKELCGMKKSAFLINTARGSIVDETALVDVLQAKQIAGAALDVFVEEPVNPESKLLALENVILTPHIAYKTEEALQRRAAVTVQNIIDFFEGENGNRVN